MPELKIDGLRAMVPEGATLLEAAKSVFVEIPTLCQLKDEAPETSCMLCVVKDCATGRLVPACSERAKEGMEIDSSCEEVLHARREILNLLLSEHVGDCVAPCSRICPAQLDIPRMLRETERGHEEQAAWIARRDLAIPWVLGHICPAPCEKGCRRGQVDSTVAIQSIHRQLGTREGSVPYFSNHENTGLTPGVNPGEDSKIKGLTPCSGKTAAVMGSGPAGLAAAWQLQLLGYACTVFDDRLVAGGALAELPEEQLPAAVLQAEIAALESAGIQFELGHGLSMHAIAERFSGVIFAETEFSGAHFEDAFYAEEHRLAVKAVANGKAAAVALDQFLKGERPRTEQRFDSKVGKLREREAQALVAGQVETGGQDVRAPSVEAARCLHCDCRKPISCKLRKYAEKYGASQRAYPADERAQLQVIGHHQSVVFEPGKCVKCGLCIRITRQAGEELGLTFVGRGFNTQVAVPFGESLEDGLKEAALACVDACPTGALAFRTFEEQVI